MDVVQDRTDGEQVTGDPRVQLPCCRPGHLPMPYLLCTSVVIVCTAATYYIVRRVHTTQDEETKSDAKPEAHSAARDGVIDSTDDGRGTLRNTARV